MTETSYLCLVLNWTHSHFYLCSLGCFCEQRCLAVLLLQVISLPLSFVFLQVFGDYYHFRHHAVERRALSGHKGMHIKLQKEPQVSCQLSDNPLWHSLLATKTKRQIGLHIYCVYITRDKGVAALMTACQILFILKNTFVLPSVPLTHSTVYTTLKNIIRFWSL